MISHIIGPNEQGHKAILLLVISSLRLQLHGAIYRPDSFVSMLPYYANLKAMRYESTSLNRIAADKSHRVIAALVFERQYICCIRLGSN